MNKQYGFTLLELLMVLALVAILTGMAVPAYKDSVRKNRLATQTNDVIGTFSLARSEAIKRGEVMKVCTSSNQTTCSGSSNWHNGWVLMDSGSVVLRVWPSVSEYSQLVATAGGSTSASEISFTTRGLISDATADNSSRLVLTLTAPNCGSGEKRVMTLSNLGLLKTVKSDC